jgi:hypothetical protein
MKFKLEPRHKWFSAASEQEEDSWMGPHDTIEAAVDCCIRNYFDGRITTVFVCQGHKSRKDERSEMGMDYEWFMDSELGMFKITVSDDGIHWPETDAH